jgi:hypothetical protein
VSTYRLYVDSTKTEHTTKGSSPTIALRKLCSAADVALASQDGRYGRLTDGRSCAALTEPWGRVDAPDARTTRLLPNNRKETN